MVDFTAQEIGVAHLARTGLLSHEELDMDEVYSCKLMNEDENEFDRKILVFDGKFDEKRAASIN